jgi:hypothetical protein
MSFIWARRVAWRTKGKFTVQGNKMTILDDDQKQQKATVVKASINQSQ